MSSRTRVKICGITRREDALAAAEAGADAIGLVFFADSPRAVTISQAQQITDGLLPFVSVVALFVDAEPDYVGEVLSEVPIDCVQFHGSELPEQCERYNMPFYKALRMDPDCDPVAFSNTYRNGNAILLDAYDAKAQGGTGETFDWTRIPSTLTKPLILAGGLDVANVAAAVKQVQPFAVDVSSGVESAKGIKDKQKIQEFIQQVNGAQS